MSGLEHMCIILHTIYSLIALTTLHLPYFVLVLGICKISFQRQLLYILKRLFHTGSTVAMAICVVEKKSPQKKEKGRSVQTWQGNNWFHYIQPADSPMTVQWQARWKRLCLCLSRNKLLLGSGLCGPHSLIKWDQTYIPLTSLSLLLRNLKVQRQIP